MRELYLSRATLKRNPAIEALGDVLLPSDPSRRLHTDHRLVWSLFAGNPDAERDFLFRREDRGAPATRARFLILSHRRPNKDQPLFDVETKPFVPALARGDRLGFSLLANPAVTRNHTDENGKKTKRRHDVVMDALSSIPKEQRAAKRPEAIAAAGRAWLERQAEACGFSIENAEALNIDGYDQFEIDRRAGADRGRPGKKDAISVSVLAFDGFLHVQDPEVFLGALAKGFGRARAFGCGLMLIRRA
ncbi:MAG: type I-E CRISPR-associated protein Cas6/Cse3/CasE [Methylocystis sp.]